MGKTQRNGKGAKGPTPQLRSRNTRSSKGRLLTDTTSSTSQLTSQLSLLGLYPAPTIGDGNCLFRALSDQLYGSPSRHYELRQQICDHIAKHKTRYEPFVEDERGLDGHLGAMRELATYGGHMELSAFAHMTKRNVKVVQPGLVYVIEWEAGGEEETPAPASTEGEGSPRRSRRMSSRSKDKEKIKMEDGKEEVRVKVGKGYYVYEEVSSDEDEEEELTGQQEQEGDGSAGPTVYVAYHDWEHFSSIRNLRGPHTGLPMVCETPPPGASEADPPTKAAKAKEAEKERKKEREKKEKERKEKEKERRGRERTDDKAGSVLKLKLPGSAVGSSTSLAVAGNASTSASSTFQAPGAAQDPMMIPLPSSRSASPFIFGQASPSLTGTPPPSASLPSSSLSSEVYPDEVSSTGTQPASSEPSSSQSQHGELMPGRSSHTLRHPHILQTPRSQYRSPKRSFDDSSASGGEDGGDSEKRTRRRVGSVNVVGSGLRVNREGEMINLGGVEGEADGMEVDVDVDVDRDPDADPGGDTPGLSAPGSSSSSSTTSSSRESSSPVDDGEADGSEAEVEKAVDPSTDLFSTSPPESGSADVTVRMGTAAATSATAGAMVMPEGLSKKARQRYLHTHLHSVGGEKPLTRRQRKALGLPKVRPARAGDAHANAMGTSAGKIVIPGGRWKGRSGDGGDGAQVQVADALAADEEWRRNGTGRLDVRGFRELKI